MMNLLARLDPGDAVTRAVLVALVQMSVVILMADLMGRALLRQRADARHGLWLGALVWVLISPAVVAVADRSGLALWVVALPFPGPGASPDVNEISAAAAVTGIPRSDSSPLGADQTSGPAPVGAASGDEAMAISRVASGKPEAHCPSMPAVSRRGSAWVGGVVLLWVAGWPGWPASWRVGGGWRRSLGPVGRLIPWHTARLSSGSACARRGPIAPAGHFAHGGRASRGRPVQAMRRVARGSGRGNFQRVAARRPGPRMRPRVPPRSVGRPAATLGGRALLAAPAGPLPQRPAHAGSRGGLRQPRAPVRRPPRLRPHALGLD